MHKIGLFYYKITLQGTDRSPDSDITKARASATKARASAFFFLNESAIYQIDGDKKHLTSVTTPEWNGNGIIPYLSPI